MRGAENRYDADVSELVGLTLFDVTYNPPDEIRFRAVDGREWRMFHDQDCCESVEVQDIAGDLTNLVGPPILDARCETNDDPIKGESQPDSHLWTFYIFRTMKGTVTIRWLGVSNGYYSESVNFKQTLDFKSTVRTGFEQLGARLPESDAERWRVEAGVAAEAGRIGLDLNDPAALMVAWDAYEERGPDKRKQED